MTDKTTHFGYQQVPEDEKARKVGGVFTSDVIETYIAYKRETEIDAIRMRPHPWEFALYHDA